MVAGIVGPASVLFDDDSFCIPRAAVYFGVYIIFKIVALGKATLAIPKLAPSDIAWQGLAMAGLESYQ
jgi:hypothetical protein